MAELDDFAKALEKAIDDASEEGRRAMVTYLGARLNQQAQANEQLPARLQEVAQQSADGTKKSHFGRLRPLAGLRPLATTNPLASRPPTPGGPLGAGPSGAARPVAVTPEDIEVAGAKFRAAFRASLEGSPLVRSK